MTLSLRCDEFVEILQAHPFAQLVETAPGDFGNCEDRYSCSSVEDNLFVIKVDRALELACGDDIEEELRDLHSVRDEARTMLRRWTSQERKAFFSRNGAGVGRYAMALYDADPKTKYLIDSRLLGDKLECLISTVQSMHMEQQNQRHILNDLLQGFNVESRITSSSIVDKLFKMEQVQRRMERHLLPEVPVRAMTSLPVKIIPFSIESKDLPTSASLSEITTAFFTKDYRRAYEYEVKSPAWSEYDKSVKTKLKNAFSLIKRVVRLVLMNADSFPETNANAATSRAEYKKDVYGLARAAEDRIRVALRFDDKSVITRRKLERQPGLSDLEKALSLPSNTPDHWRKFFT